MRPAIVGLLHELGVFFFFFSFLLSKARVLLPVVCERAGLSLKPQKAQFEASLTKLLHSSVLETAVRELERKAGGLFLYASLLARQLEGSVGGKIDFKQLRGLPVGLSEVYQTNFERMVQSREDWHKHFSPLIALIVAAREPLPVTLAKEVRNSFGFFFSQLWFFGAFSSLMIFVVHR